MFCAMGPLAGLLLLAAAAMPTAATPAAPAPSLRNGLPGEALRGHRWLSVDASDGNPVGLESQALALGVPSHLAWVTGAGALELIVPPALEANVSRLLLSGRESTVLREDAQQWLEGEKAARSLHPAVASRAAMPKDEFYRAWRTLDEIMAYMQDIAANAGSGVQVNEIVVGETHEGRPIRGFTIEPIPWTKGQEKKTKRPDLPKIMMHGCHHSGECKLPPSLPSSFPRRRPHRPDPFA